MPIFVQTPNKFVLFTLEAKLVFLAYFAHFGVFGGQAILEEGNCVGQTLHHRIEKARVPMVVHSKGHPLYLALFVPSSTLSEHQVHCGVRRFLIVASFASLRHWGHFGSGLETFGAFEVKLLIT